MPQGTASGQVGHGIHNARELGQHPVAYELAATVLRRPHLSIIAGGGCRVADGERQRSLLCEQRLYGQDYRIPQRPGSIDRSEPNQGGFDEVFRRRAKELLGVTTLIAILLPNEN